MREDLAGTDGLAIGVGLTGAAAIIIKRAARYNLVVAILEEATPICPTEEAR